MACALSCSIDQTVPGRWEGLEYAVCQDSRAECRPGELGRTEALPHLEKAMWGLIVQGYTSMAHDELELKLLKECPMQE